MKTAAASLLFMALLASSGWCLDIFKTETVFLERYDNASMPADIAMNGKGDFVIYDAMKGGMQAYKAYKARGDGYYDGLFKGGVCLVAQDKLYYLCDSPGKRVLILDKNFKPSGEIKDGPKFDPTDAVKYKNRLFIVDNDNHRLVIFDMKNKSVSGSFGKRGSELGSFSYPFSIAVDNDGYVFVSEVINTRLQMITPAMKGTYSIGKWGVEAGQLYRPKGVAIYKNKYLIVSDGYLGVLQIFDMNGNFVGALGDASGGIKRYESPTRIRIYGDDLAVVDPYGRLVEILRIGGLE